MATKDRIYSWRLQSDLKSALEDAARARRTSVADLLDRIARRWLEDQSARSDDAEVQERLHNAASRSLGTIRGGDPHRAENASQNLRTMLARRHAH